MLKYRVILLKNQKFKGTGRIKLKNFYLLFSGSTNLTLKPIRLLKYSQGSLEFFIESFLRSIIVSLKLMKPL